MLRADITYNHPADPTIIRVGTGSGSLTINQTALGAVDGKKILIQAGSYSTITIEDFEVADNERIFIYPEGVVEITEGMTLTNLKGVTIKGNGLPGSGADFHFNDIATRAIRIGEKFTFCTLEGMIFTNVGDYAIAHESNINNLAYDGTPATRSESLKFINLTFINANGFHFGGYLNYDSVEPANNEDICFMKDVEIANCTFTDTPDAGSVIFMGNVEDYNIHHNTFERLNADNNNHNGLTMVVGSGEYHNNYLNEYQGNAIRAWIYSRGDTPKKVKIYNNICANTRKYSGFEFQSFARLIWPTKTTTAIGECFHNTVYNMHYEDNSGTPSGNYHGVILDIFDLVGSTADAWNNVGISFAYPSGANYLWGNDVPTNTYPNSNRYYATLAAAGLSTDDLFNPQVGSPLFSGDYRVNPYTITDYYGNERTGFPTIGAVQ